MTPLRDPWYFQRWAYGTVTGSLGRKAVLSALAVLADATTGRCEAKLDVLAQYVEASERTVRAHLRDLERMGLVASRPQFRVDRGSRSDEFLLLAEGIVAWPDGALVVRQEGFAMNGHAPERERPQKRREVANWGELEDWQRRVLTDLRRVADAKDASLDEARALAACQDFADRDHAGAAEKFARWYLEDKGRHRARSDINRAWRKWLAAEDPAPGVAGVAESGDLDRFDFGTEE